MSSIELLSGVDDNPKQLDRSPQPEMPETHISEGVNRPDESTMYLIWTKQYNAFHLDHH